MDPEAAQIHLLPTLWFRNTWSWEKDEPKPAIRQDSEGAILASHPKLGHDFTLQCEGQRSYCFRKTNRMPTRLWGQPNPSPYVKDAFHEYVIAGKREAVNPSKVGTKAAAHYTLEVPAGGSQIVRLRLSAKPAADAFKTFDADLRQPIG